MSSLLRRILSIVKVEFFRRKGPVVLSIKMPINQIGGQTYFGNENAMQSNVSYEALRWAALEKLPTYDRAQTAVLSMPEGELKEVNTDKLGAQQRIASVGDDHECFLSKFKDRVDRYAPPPPA
ncbi:hypothetical protein ZWY2020_022600 [Hordeum vulgare]|nr:hypothetical protein ZWY2020_022600 [Hordeum vulgare]